MKKIIFLLVTVGFIFSSCEQQETIQETNTKSVPATNSISFTYRDSLYLTTYTISKDSTVIWDNKEVGDLYQKLMDLPELATLVKEDGSIVYFNNYDEVPIEKENANVLRSSTSTLSSFAINLYKDCNKGGKKYECDKNNYHIPPYEIGNFCYMKPLSPSPGYDNFNDMLSSFELFYLGDIIYPLNPCSPPYISPGPAKQLFVTLFEDINFGGKSITFTNQNATSLYVANLANYTMTSGFLGIGSKSWNDQASSVKFYAVGRF